MLVFVEKANEPPELSTQPHPIFQALNFYHSIPYQGYHIYCIIRSEMLIKLFVFTNDQIWSINVPSRIKTIIGIQMYSRGNFAKFIFWVSLAN